MTRNKRLAQVRTEIAAEAQVAHDNARVAVGAAYKALTKDDDKLALDHLRDAMMWIGQSWGFSNAEIGIVEALCAVCKRAIASAERRVAEGEHVKSGAPS